ncbi:MAG: preprotein translocase subunit SecY [Candidatus Woesearchaeota archaeon]|jgi:preprotein translocase subunit SecY|nr:preprotein translocase subunit SecY [Candidatus Woesearchaeota archaeon]
MSFYRNLLLHIPEVRGPEKKQSLKNRMLWTFGILILFLFLASVPLFGVDATQASYFKHLELLLGAKIGTLLTLGIGPIVMGSIVLQLLKGAGILKFDMNSEEGKFIYAGTHKLVTFVFIIVESLAYVAFGGIAAKSPEFFWVVVIQLGLGALIVFYMDEVVKKWGFGSGVSLFIAAGIAQAVFTQMFSPYSVTGVLAWPFGSEAPIGSLIALFYYLRIAEIALLFTEVLIPVGITVLLFFVIVFFQSINVEIPLSFGKVRGQSIKWPLNFFYSGVIPIILISALAANLRLWSTLLMNFVGENTSGFAYFVSKYLLGQVTATGTPTSGIINWIYPLTLTDHLSTILSFDVWPHMLSYMIYMVVGATVFSYFWVQTSGMDSRSQAKQIINSGLQIPGFRKDERIIERVLDRYIVPLTIMGGIGIGLLAFTADTLSALTSGTGILLLVMIIYQMYQQLARESMDDFALLKKVMRK